MNVEDNNNRSHSFSEGSDNIPVGTISPKPTSPPIGQVQGDDEHQISSRNAQFEPYRDNPNENVHTSAREHTTSPTSPLIGQVQGDERQISSRDEEVHFEPYRDNPGESVIYTSFDESPDDDDKCGSDDEGGGSSSGRSARKLWVATSISLLFFSIELVGGLIAGSLALLSDSFHLLSDIVSFAISLLSIYLARRPKTKELSYGYHRAEILGALISIALIWALTGYLCVEAYDRIRNPQYVDGETMCIVASIGVGVNIILILVLGHDHGHGHGHSHDHEHGHGHDHGNLNVRAALLHVLGDLLSSIGVLISSIVILFDQGKTWVDPLCTFIFSALVMATTFGILRSTIRVLMEATPSHIDANAVEEDLKSISGVESVHNLHIWDLTLGRTALTAHLRLRAYNPDVRAEPYVPSDILSEARRLLRRHYKISSVTIQIDS